MQTLLSEVPLIALIISLLALLVNVHVAHRNAIAAQALAKQQMDNMAAVAHRQILAPMRQKWIDSLRQHIASLITVAQAQWIFHGDNSAAQKELLEVYRNVELMLNPQEEDHRRLRVALDRLIEVVVIERKGRGLHEFTEALTEATSRTQVVLKREWERVKNEK